MLTSCLHNRSLGILHRPDHENESQKKPQLSLRAQHPVSPYSLLAVPDEVLHSDSNPQFESIGLEDIFDDGREPSVSIGNNEYEEHDLSDFETWTYNTEEEMGRGARNTILEPSSVAAGQMDSQSFRDNVQSKTSHAVPKSPNTCAQFHQAMMQPADFPEEIDAGFKSGSPVGLGVSANDSSIQAPSIFISNSGTEDVADGYPHDLSASYYSIMSRTNPTNMSRHDPQFSYKPVALIQRNIRPRNLHSYPPNNYEIATHDRQPPDIPSGINPRSEKIAVDSLDAFCIDADLTAADVAATNRTDPGLLHVKRRRPSGYLPVPQTPTGPLLPMQHRQNSSRYLPISSAFQNSLQVSTYPTPSLSSKDSSPYHHLDRSHTRDDDPPSTQARPSRVNSVEPPSPISPSPSSLSDAADGVTRCPRCPHTVFTGKPETRKNSLQRHNRDNHEGMERLLCLLPDCTVTFGAGRKDNLKKHVRATHPKYPLPPPYTKRKRDPDSELDSQ